MHRNHHRHGMFGSVRQADRPSLEAKHTGTLCGTPVQQHVRLSQTVGTYFGLMPPNATPPPDPNAQRLGHSLFGCKSDSQFGHTPSAVRDLVRGIHAMQETLTPAPNGACDARDLDQIYSYS
jgi:hypothetical protein